jgi:hypothetical protein
MTQLRSLVVSFSPLNSTFNLRAVRVGCVARDGVFSKYLSFPLPIVIGPMLSRYQGTQSHPNIKIPKKKSISTRHSYSVFRGEVHRHTHTHKYIFIQTYTVEQAINKITKNTITLFIYKMLLCKALRNSKYCLYTNLDKALYPYSWDI